jgi:hypothetical protein
LGASEVADLLAPTRLATGARATVLHEERGHAIWRVPLPGTPDESGRMREPPRGAGTGWLWVQQFRGRPAALAWARCTAPRSTSLAARQWNLICHLEAAGVGVPQLVALVERGSPVAAGESCLITRELEGFERLSTWLDRPHSAEQLAAGVESVRHFLARLTRSRVWLDRLELDDVWIRSRADDAVANSDCAALDLERLQATQAVRSQLRSEGLAIRRLSAVACGMFALGRIASRESDAAERAFAAKLERALAARSSHTVDSGR